LCDGKTYEGIETPNLAERFVLGVSSLDQIKSTGGASSVTLTTDNLPPHSHKYAGDDQITNINDGNYSPGENIVSNCGGYDAKSETQGNGKVYNTSKTGSGVSFSVMPPYYKLAYIMRIK
jgi:microcystin-dependent protein